MRKIHIMIHLFEFNIAMDSCKWLTTTLILWFEMDSNGICPSTSHLDYRLCL